MARGLPFQLTENEELIVELPRSKAPYIIIFGLGLLFSGFFFANFLQLYSASSTSWVGSIFSIDIKSGTAVAPIFIGLASVALLFSLIAAYIYSANRMFITNEHIVRIEQHGLVATDRKVITHLNIEDVKARQNIMGRLLNYGKLTLSTEGQNATYVINYIKNVFEHERLITDTRDSYQKSVIDDGGRAIPVVEKR